LERWRNHSIPDDGYVFAAKRRKGISKDLNPDSLWIDMPFLIQIASQSEGHRSEGKSIWEDTDLSEKRFQRTQICMVKGHRFGGTVIL
jgi:hypothetical protein